MNDVSKIAGPPKACRKMGGGEGNNVRSCRWLEIPILNEVIVVVVVVFFHYEIERKVVALARASGLVGAAGIPIVVAAACFRKQASEGNVRGALLQDALRLPEVGRDDGVDVAAALAGFVLRSRGRLRRTGIVLVDDVQRPGVPEGPLLVSLRASASRRSAAHNHRGGRADREDRRSLRGLLLGDGCRADHFAREGGGL